MFLRLNIPLSNSGASRNSDRNLSTHSLLVYYRFLNNFFRINRSWNLFFPDYWCLNNSLLDDWLWNYFFSDDGLGDYLSRDNWLWYDFLGLNNLGFTIQNLFRTSHTNQGLSTNFSTLLNHHFTTILHGHLSTVNRSSILSHHLLSIHLTTLISIDHLTIPWWNEVDFFNITVFQHSLQIFLGEILYLIRRNLWHVSWSVIDIIRIQTFEA